MLPELRDEKHIATMMVHVDIAMARVPVRRIRQAMAIQLGLDRANQVPVDSWWQHVLVASFGFGVIAAPRPLIAQALQGLGPARSVMVHPALVDDSSCMVLKREDQRYRIIVILDRVVVRDLDVNDNFRCCLLLLLLQLQALKDETCFTSY